MEEEGPKETRDALEPLGRVELLPLSPLQHPQQFVSVGRYSAFVVSQGYRSGRESPLCVLAIRFHHLVGVTFRLPPSGCTTTHE